MAGLQAKKLKTLPAKKLEKASGAKKSLGGRAKIAQAIRKMR